MPAYEPGDRRTVVMTSCDICSTGTPASDSTGTMECRNSRGVHSNGSRRGTKAKARRRSCRGWRRPSWSRAQTFTQVRCPAITHVDAAVGGGGTLTRHPAASLPRPSITLWSRPLMSRQRLLTGGTSSGSASTERAGTVGVMLRLTRNTLCGS